MIHKYLAGLIDQYQLAGNTQALDVASRLADWVDQPHQEPVLPAHAGDPGRPSSVACPRPSPTSTRSPGTPATLKTAERFYHAHFLDALAAKRRRTQRRAVQCLDAEGHLGPEAGRRDREREVLERGGQLLAASRLTHHSYAIGGQGNYEHWGPPDIIAGTLSNYNCEGCVSYNMLKLTRLLHFHDPGNPAYLDYYERTLVNHLLGTQDPGSPHGFVAYYTGLSPGAHKQDPANYFPGANENAYATDYDTFTCDTATGLETPTRFIDTIYTRDPDGALRVNLFIPSQVSIVPSAVSFGGLTFRQATSIPESRRRPSRSSRAPAR